MDVFNQEGKNGHIEALALDITYTERDSNSRLMTFDLLQLLLVT